MKEFKVTKDWKLVKLEATEFSSARNEIQYGLENDIEQLLNKILY